MSDAMISIVIAVVGGVLGSIICNFLYHKFGAIASLVFTLSIAVLVLCLIGIIVTELYKESYQFDHELVTYSVYIDGVRNETDKAVNVKLIDSKYSEYVDFDTGNIRSVQSGVYDVCEYGISCKTDDIIVFSVLPGYNIISWDGVDPVKVTDRRAIFIQKNTKGEHNIIINLKKL